jgi:PIN domain nuclease of toxin-antitoxin system
MMLLDTHVLIWLAEGAYLEDKLRSEIGIVEASGALSVSAVSAWELGLLTAKNRVQLSLPFEIWWRAAVTATELRVLPLDSEIAIASTRLPGSFHADPADRFLVATARHFDLPLVTADKSILAYSKAGHLKAIRAR